RDGSRRAVTKRSQRGARRASRATAICKFVRMRLTEGKMEEMSGAQFLAETFEGYGVTHVFLVPTILSATLAEVEKRTGIARVLTHGEKAAAYMADGYARATGRPGICMA